MAARDIIQAAAGAAGATEANYIEDVFQTYLYNGTGATQTINNGIDLATKGGLVWIKSRSNSSSHQIYDTARGATKQLRTTANGQQTRANGLTSFTTSGYVLGSDGNYEINTLDYTYASWVFRKQPKFFTMVTWTGDGTDNRLISHDLGCTPGMVLAKDFTLGANTNWITWHKSLGNMTNNLYLDLNLAKSQDYMFSSTNLTATSTTFPVSASNGFNTPNQSGQTYVAYLFADSNSGGFGPAGTDSVVACGSYIGTGAAGLNVSLGWEPQFILIKSTDDTGSSWWLHDNMRGMPLSGGTSQLAAENSNAESIGGGGGNIYVVPTATGFRLDAASSRTNGSGVNYIYLAIRRGPMKTPTDATKVFAPVVGLNTTKPGFTSNFPVDLALWTSDKSSSGLASPQVATRLLGTNRLLTSDTSAEVSNANNSFDSNTGWFNGFSGYPTAWSVMFRRAPGFFDVVCYTGTGSAQTLNHSLGVTPEMWIIKRRNASGDVWRVGTYLPTSSPQQYYTALDSGSGYVQMNVWGVPTSTTFGIGAMYPTESSWNASGGTYVAYLFASCPGVSKIGTYTGTGATQQINCGFSSGARFVLIKRLEASYDWYVWDSARGIVSGNDPYLLLNSTAAEVTNTDYIDPYSAGFEISSSAPAAINASGGTFIYLAIA